MPDNSVLTTGVVPSEAVVEYFLFVLVGLQRHQDGVETSHLGSSEDPGHSEQPDHTLDIICILLENCTK